MRRRRSPCGRMFIMIVREYIEALEEEMKVRNSLETNEQMIVEARATVRGEVASSELCGSGSFIPRTNASRSSRTLRRNSRDTSA